MRSYLEFLSEMQANGDVVWATLFPFADETREQFIDRWFRAESHPVAPLVADSLYWAVEPGGEVDGGDKVVGRISLRHELNDHLREYGGHIGYEVRPADRRRGISKQMLKLLLQTPKAREIGKLLVTCAPTNEASVRTILANGGVFEKTVFVSRVNRDTSYYWITL